MSWDEKTSLLYRLRDINIWYQRNAFGDTFKVLARRYGRSPGRLQKIYEREENRYQYRRARVNIGYGVEQHYIVNVNRLLNKLGSDLQLPIRFE